MQNFENLTEKQVESREIFDGYIMHVFKDTVELPNGKLAPREYMRHVGGLKMDEWVYEVALDLPCAEGVHAAQIVIDSVSPMSFVLN